MGLFQKPLTGCFFLFSFSFIFQIWNHCQKEGLVFWTFRSRSKQCAKIISRWIRHFKYAHCCHTLKEQNIFLGWISFVEKSHCRNGRRGHGSICSLAHRPHQNTNSNGGQKEAARVTPASSRNFRCLQENFGTKWNFWPMARVCAKRTTSCIS